MSMQVSSTSAQTMAQSASINNWQQRRQDMQQLAQALLSGDLGAAQSAYSTLTRDFPNIASNPNSPLAQVGQALQSNSVSGAQSAFAAIHHGHHHHHSSGVQASTATTPTDTATPGTSQSIADTTSTLLNAIA